MASPPANGYADQESQPTGTSEPGVGQALSQIQHIIKDSAGQRSSPSSRPHSSGYSSPKEAASPLQNFSPAEPARSSQHGYAQSYSDRSTTGVEDGMSEISISEATPDAGNTKPSQSGLKPRLSERHSLQPPPSPFAMDGEPLGSEEPKANGMQSHQVEVSTLRPAIGRTRKYLLVTSACALSSLS